MKRDWSKLPHNHSGKWKSEYDSIMNPGSKCTLPQLIAQWVLDTRSKYMKTFPKIQKGKGWSLPISKQVRALCQQGAVLCDYFPHPSEDPLVYAAFRSFFTKNRVFKIGQYRKYRITKDGKINITQDEKDIVNALEHEYKQLKEKQQNIVQVKQEVIHYTQEVTTYKVKPHTNKKGAFSNLIDIEESLNGSKG